MIHVNYSTVKGFEDIKLFLNAFTESLVETGEEGRVLICVPSTSYKVISNQVKQFVKKMPLLALVVKGSQTEKPFDSEMLAQSYALYGNFPGIIAFEGERISVEDIQRFKYCSVEHRLFLIGDRKIGCSSQAGDGTVRYILAKLTKSTPIELSEAGDITDCRNIRVEVRVTTQVLVEGKAVESATSQGARPVLASKKEEARQVAPAEVEESEGSEDSVSAETEAPTAFLGSSTGKVYKTKGSAEKYSDTLEGSSVKEIESGFVVEFQGELTDDLRDRLVNVD